MVWHGVVELFFFLLISSCVFIFLFTSTPFFIIVSLFKIICDCCFVMHRPSSFVSISFCAFYRLFCRLKTHFHIQLVSTLIYFLDSFFFRSFESGYDFNYRLRVWCIKIMTQFIHVVATLLVETIMLTFLCAHPF